MFFKRQSRVETAWAVGVAEWTLDAAAERLGGFALPAINVVCYPTGCGGCCCCDGVRQDDERLRQVPRPARRQGLRWAAAA